MNIHNFNKSTGWTNLKMPLFYESNNGLRFDTRTADIDIGTLEYFDNAVEKAISIFLDIFEEEKLFYLVINSVDEKLKFDIKTWSLSDEILECFNISKMKCINELIPYIYEDDEELITIRSIIKVRKEDFDYYEMIKRICRQDIGRNPSISDEVFILNNKMDIAYNFYDDRGVDVASKNGESLLELYQLRKAWLYDYEDEHVVKIILNGVYY